MTKISLFVDYENIKPDLNLLALFLEDKDNYVVFSIGKNTIINKPTIEVLNLYSKQTEILRATEKGKNAADFLIVLHMGKTAFLERDKDELYYVLSGDTDFDSVIDYLNQNFKLKYRRITSLNFIFGEDEQPEDSDQGLGLNPDYDDYMDLIVPVLVSKYQAVKKHILEDVFKKTLGKSYDSEQYQKIESYLRKKRVLTAGSKDVLKVNVGNVIVLTHLLITKIKSKVTQNSISFENFKNVAKKYLKSIYGDNKFGEMIAYMKERNFITEIKHLNYLLHFEGISPQEAKNKVLKKMDDILIFPDTKNQFTDLLDLASGVKFSNGFANHVIKLMSDEQALMTFKKKKFIIVKTLNGLTVKGALIEILKFNYRNRSNSAEIPRDAERILGDNSSWALSDVIDLFLDPKARIDFKKIYSDFLQTGDIIPNLFSRHIETDLGEKLFYKKLTDLLDKTASSGVTFKGQADSLQKSLTLTLKDAYHTDIYKWYEEYSKTKVTHSVPETYLKDTNPPLSLDDSISLVCDEFTSLKERPKNEGEFHLFCDKISFGLIPESVGVKILERFKTQKIVSIDSDNNLKFAKGAFAPSPDKTVWILLEKYGLQGLPKTRIALTSSLKEIINPNDYSLKLKDEVVKIMESRGFIRKSPVKKISPDSAVNLFTESDPLFNLK
jgi:hypothetical protein